MSAVGARDAGDAGDLFSAICAVIYRDQTDGLDPPSLNATDDIPEAVFRADWVAREVMACLGDAGLIPPHDASEPNYHPAGQEHCPEPRCVCLTQGVAEGSLGPGPGNAGGEVSA